MRIWKLSLYYIDIVMLLIFATIIIIPLTNYNIKSLLTFSKQYILVFVAIVVSAFFLIVESRTIDQYLYLLQVFTIIFFVVLVHFFAQFNEHVYGTIIKSTLILGFPILLLYFIWVLGLSDWFLHIARDPCQECPGMGANDRRLFFGAYTPNEAGRFLLFLIFCLTELKVKKFNKLYKLAIFPFAFFTGSKTTILQITIFFITSHFRLFAVSTLFLALISVSIFNVDLSKNLASFAADFSSEKSSNSIRIDQFNNVLNNWQFYWYYPLFGSEDFGLISSVHNGFMNLYVNLGGIPIVIFTIGVMIFFKNRKSKQNKKIIIFILLDTLIYVFNPFLLGRPLFLPLAIYISQLRKK